MGSTVLALKADGLDYQLAWVGDCRAYLWDSSGMLKQITCDHSYVENLIREGVISEQEALSHPQKNLITQAVGSTVHGGLKIDLVNGRLGVGQTLILCSDGLVDEVSDSTIA